ncbi:hypothetical protein SCH4B_3552 [Ruegeria sp. TrichCH4B]|nr:hypothetical protein SCH4B_3552 [Ruegeria sp. TrichCH4B]
MMQSVADRAGDYLIEGHGSPHRMSARDDQS